MRTISIFLFALFALLFVLLDSLLTSPILFIFRNEFSFILIKTNFSSTFQTKTDFAWKRLFRFIYSHTHRTHMYFHRHKHTTHHIPSKMNCFCIVRHHFALILKCYIHIKFFHFYLPCCCFLLSFIVDSRE